MAEEVIDTGSLAGDPSSYIDLKPCRTSVTEFLSTNGDFMYPSIVVDGVTDIRRVLILRMTMPARGVVVCIDFRT